MNVRVVGMGGDNTGKTEANAKINKKKETTRTGVVSWKITVSEPMNTWSCADRSDVRRMSMETSEAELSVKCLSGWNT